MSEETATNNTKDSLEKIHGPFESVWIRFINLNPNINDNKDAYTDIFIVENPDDEVSILRVNEVKGQKCRIMPFSAIPDGVLKFLLNKHASGSQIPCREGASEATINFEEVDVLESNRFEYPMVEKLEVLPVMITTTADPDFLGKLSEITQIYS